MSDETSSSNTPLTDFLFGKREPIIVKRIDRVIHNDYPILTLKEQEIKQHFFLHYFLAASVLAPIYTYSYKKARNLWYESYVGKMPVKRGFFSRTLRKSFVFLGIAMITGFSAGMATFNVLVSDLQKLEEEAQEYNQNINVK
eukprot:TRINITY_DN5082_c0_g1_i1.p1 TRINITY_DN5082_c0_g1~~TRINITY_DN5082_c0_g1_i1.p1  ORF type:complete len:142 (-),score=12.15 TRINITY_DN5082_c0_g1_i1:66-491(-)